MRIALIGLPGSGKSSVFACVTGDSGCFHSFSVDEPYAVTVLVPDERMDYLRELVGPKKFSPLHIEMLDYHGLFAGGGSRDSMLLSDVRDADGQVIVLRGFTDDAGKAPDPLADLESVCTELLLGDMGQVERRIKRLRVQVTKPTPNQKGDRAELAALEICAKYLDEGRPISDVEMSDAEQKMLRGFRFLTGKPMMALVNVDENFSVPDGDIAKLGERCRLVEVMNSAIEMEIAELDESDRAEFMADYGVTEPAAGRFLGAAMTMLDMRCFFTTAVQDLRAWEIPAGATALDAAGKVHTDIARGFIRAEVIHFDDLKELGSFRAVKAAKKETAEGKGYVVRDGDIINIRFNV